jgi:crotonobetainyl-CoA:carnitine CoA-transferase CaiB-like acyl-CoA transferase
MAVEVSYDSKKLRMLGNPVKVDGMKREYVRAPFLGEHTGEILKKMLGYSEDKIKSLKEEGVV